MAEGKNHEISNHHVVDGLLVPTFITQQRVDELKSFKLRSEDVFVVTYPKSGTTWVQQIVKLIREQGEDDKKMIVDTVPWLESSSVELKLANEMPSPRAFKSHSPYHMMAGGPPYTTPAKYIYVARNPKDVAVSMYHHVKGIEMFQYSGTWDHFFQLFISGKVECGLWFDHVLEWWKHRDAENIIFLKYEDMKKDHCGAVKKIAEFIGCDVKEEIVEKIVEQSTFESMKENPATNYQQSKIERKPGAEKFMRKGIVGDWRNYFTPEQTAEFDAVYSENMEGSGLHLDFN